MLGAEEAWATGSALGSATSLAVVVEAGASPSISPCARTS